MNESLIKLARRAIPDMPKPTYRALKRALREHANTAKLRGALRKQFKKTIAKHSKPARVKASVKASIPQSIKIPSALERFRKHAPLLDARGQVIQ